MNGHEEEGGKEDGKESLLHGAVSCLREEEERGRRKEEGL